MRLTECAVIVLTLLVVLWIPGGIIRTEPHIQTSEPYVGEYARMKFAEVVASPPGPVRDVERAGFLATGLVLVVLWVVGYAVPLSPRRSLRGFAGRLDRATVLLLLAGLLALLLAPLGGAYVPTVAERYEVFAPTLAVLRLTVGLTVLASAAAFVLRIVIWRRRPL